MAQAHAIMTVMRCAMCATPASTAATDVVSSNFTDLDLWRSRGSQPMLCDDCASRYRDPALRRSPHRIDREGCHPLTYADCASLLSAPLPADVAVTVPIGGRKHIWHHAVGGHVTTDNLPRHLWTDSCATRLSAVRQLRTLGFGEAAIAELSPRWPVLSRLNPHDRQMALALWDTLADWRTIWTPLLAIAIRATRTDKPEAA